jgi:hypothetical protein
VHSARKEKTYPILLEVVWQVGYHNLGLGGNAILRRTTLLALTRLTGSGGLLVVGALLCGKRFIRGLCQGHNLAGYICGGGLSGSLVGQLDLLGTFSAVGLLTQYD